jgi:hypothetical protein
MALLPLDDLEGSIDGDALDRDGDAARGPVHLQAGDASRFPQADSLDQAVAAVTGAARRRPVDDPPGAAPGLLDLDADRRPDAHPVGLRPHQLDGQPVVALAEVLEQQAERLVAGGSDVSQAGLRLIHPAGILTLEP